MPRMTDSTRAGLGNAVVWVAGRIPRKLAADPERVALYLAFIILGASGLVFVRPNSLNALLPAWAGYLWAAMLLAGALAALTGYWSDDPARTRAGHRLLLLACVVIVWSVIAVFGRAGITTSTVFTLIGAAYLIHLIRSAAARIIKRRNGGSS